MLMINLCKQPVDVAFTTLSAFSCQFSISLIVACNKNKITFLTFFKVGSGASLQSLFAVCCLAAVFI